jgi:23S rRNA (uracil1939-C5)-methyltransferase
MSQPTLSDILEKGEAEVEIDRYADQGKGRVDLADGTLVVAGVLPGERVRVALDPDEKAGERMEARLVEVLEPSDERRDPLCERDDVCRGCQLRHATIGEEMNYKRRAVREAVERHAGLPVDEQPEIETVAPFPLRRGDAHRMRVELVYREPESSEVEIGLATPVREALVPMGDCPALTGSTRRLVGYLEAVLEDLAEPPPDFEASDKSGETAGSGIRSIALTSPTYGRGLVDVLVGGIEDTEEFLNFLECERVERFVDALVERLPEDVGLSMHGGESREVLEPPRRVRFPLARMRLVAGFGDWLPVTLEPTEALYEHVLEQLDLGGDDRILDVGCGIGSLTILGAQRAESVVGVDINRQSIEAAELNAVENDVHNVEFAPSGWEKALRELALEDRSFSVATLNPPRTTIGERALAYLAELGVERAMYLGPSVESAARDLGVLREKGWEVHHLAAANLDPATAGAMLVAKVAR